MMLPSQTTPFSTAFMVVTFENVMSLNHNRWLNENRITYFLLDPSFAFWSASRALQTGSELCLLFSSFSSALGSLQVVPGNVEVSATGVARDIR